MYELLVKNKNLNSQLDGNFEGEENTDESDNDNDTDEKKDAVDKVNCNVEIIDSEDSDNDKDGVPKDYLFLSYFVFIMWGPFAK